MALHKFGVQTLGSPSLDNILVLCEESGLGYTRTGRKAANHNDVYDKKAGETRCQVKPDISWASKSSMVREIVRGAEHQ